jgi:hypothetical protein
MNPTLSNVQYEPNTVKSVDESQIRPIIGLDYRAGMQGTCPQAPDLQGVPNPPE